MKKLPLEDALPLIQQTLNIPKEKLEIMLDVPLDVPEKLEIYVTFPHQDEEYTLQLTHMENKHESYTLRLFDKNEISMYKDSSIMSKSELIKKIQESQKILPEIKEKMPEIEGGWIRGKFYEKRKQNLDYKTYSRIKKQSFAF
ncbi:MAG: hypothetical protein PF569_06155 [Candidatus Woesearchaeota archaeon]|jgi:hypothetical protein|nr:hypothetical protein [Candidatus Woesearchaeota archaeon]